MYKRQPGDLVLRLRVSGDMEPGARFFTLTINDETEEIVVVDGEETGFVWDTYDEDECVETHGTSTGPYCTCPVWEVESVELLLADRWKNEEKLKIAVVGNEEWCVECETRLRAQLFHRVTSYKETVRDDRICP